jgi:DNA processing protein
LERGKGCKALPIATKGKISVDEIRRQNDLPITMVSSTLAILELKGLVRQAGVMQYVLAREERAEYAVD